MIILKYLFYLVDRIYKEIERFSTPTEFKVIYNGDCMEYWIYGKKYGAWWHSLIHYENHWVYTKFDKKKDAIKFAKKIKKDGDLHYYTKEYKKRWRSEPEVSVTWMIERVIYNDQN